MSTPTLSALLGLTDRPHRDQVARRLAPLLRGPEVVRRRQSLANQAVRHLSTNLDQPLDHIVVKACEDDPAVRAAGREAVTVTLGERVLAHTENVTIELEVAGTRHVLIDITLDVELTFSALELDVVRGRITRVHPAEVVASVALAAGRVEVAACRGVPVTVGDDPQRRPDRVADVPRADAHDSVEARLRRRLGDDPATRRGARMGRLLRAIAGCDETILRSCPEERFTFSGFGAVILGTAALAAVSMTLGLTIVFDAPFVEMLPVGLLWGLFILALDRWLVSGGGRGARHVLPRVIVAVFFGFIIAEPIVLLAFDDAIADRIDRETESGGRQLRADLVNCNPEAEVTVPDPRAPSQPAASAQPPATPADCQRDHENDVLQVPWISTPTFEEGTTERATHDRLTTELHELTTKLAQEQQALQDEVAGVVRGDLSGRPGRGPASEERRAAIARDEQRLREVSDDLDRLNAETVVTRYNERLGAAIDREVSRRERRLSADPGLARRMDILSTLMTESRTILGARVGLTLFFVFVDTAPAVMRVTSSGGVYDKIRARRLAGRLDREEAVRRVASEVERSSVDSYGRIEQARVAREEAVLMASLGREDETEVQEATEGAGPEDGHRQPQGDEGPVPTATPVTRTVSRNGHDAPAGREGR